MLDRNGIDSVKMHLYVVKTLALDGELIIEPDILRDGQIVWRGGWSLGYVDPLQCNDRSTPTAPSFGTEISRLDQIYRDVHSRPLAFDR